MIAYRPTTLSFSVHTCSNACAAVGADRYYCHDTFWAVFYVHLSLVWPGTNLTESLHFFLKSRSSTPLSIPNTDLPKFYPIRPRVV